MSNNIAVAMLLEMFLKQSKDAKLCLALHFPARDPNHQLLAAKVAALDLVAAGLEAMLNGGTSSQAREGLDALIAAINDISVAIPERLRTPCYAERACVIETKLRLLEADKIIASVPDEVMFVQMPPAGGMAN